MRVVDTLSSGFRLVFQRPWLALLPLIADIGIWRGPKLSMATLVQRMVADLSTAMATMPDAGAATAGSTETMTLLTDALAGTNLFGLVTWHILGVPGIAGSLPIQPGDRVYEITVVWQLALAMVLILVLGLVLATAYLTLIAQTVRDEHVDLPGFVATAAQSWVNLAIIALVLGIAFLSTLLGISLLGPLALAAIFVLGLVLFYSAFFPQAVTLDGLKPLQAVLSSYAVVRTSFWPSAGLLFLVNLLNSGLGLVWQRLMGTAQAGMIAAVVLSSLIGTGLTTALFLHYRDRIAALRLLAAAQREAEARSSGLGGNHP